MSAPLVLTSEDVATPAAEDKRGRFNGLLAAARTKLHAPDTWRMASWDATDAEYVIVEGGVPNDARGVGRRAWKGVTLARCIVSRADVEAAEAEYERTTGHCRECSGSGEEWAGWDHIKGHSFRPCRRCGATGKPAHEVPA